MPARTLREWNLMPRSRNLSERIDARGRRSFERAFDAVRLLVFLTPTEVRAVVVVVFVAARSSVVVLLASAAPSASRAVARRVSRR